MDILERLSKEIAKYEMLRGGGQVGINEQLLRDAHKAIEQPSVAVYEATLHRTRRMIEDRIKAYARAHGRDDAWDRAWKEGMQEALFIVDALLKGEK